MSPMRIQVQCYAARKADERPIRFQLADRNYMVEEVLDHWYAQMTSSLKCGRTMAIFKSSDIRRRRTSGVWSHFGKRKNDRAGDGHAELWQRSGGASEPPPT
jgi:hypothetical protein